MVRYPKTRSISPGRHVTPHLGQGRMSSANLSASRAETAVTGRSDPAASTFVASDRSGESASPSGAEWTLPPTCCSPSVVPSLSLPPSGAGAFSGTTGEIAGAAPEPRAPLSSCAADSPASAATSASARFTEHSPADGRSPSRRPVVTGSDSILAPGPGALLADGPSRCSAVSLIGLGVVLGAKSPAGDGWRSSCFAVARSSPPSASASVSCGSRPASLLPVCSPGRAASGLLRTAWSHRRRAWAIAR